MTRDASRGSAKPPAPGLDQVIDRLGAGLRLLTHGDGSLAVFHGGREEDPEISSFCRRTRLANNPELRCRDSQPSPKAASA